MKQYNGRRAASQLFQQSLPGLTVATPSMPTQTENCPLSQNTSDMSITPSSCQRSNQTVKISVAEENPKRCWIEKTLKTTQEADQLIFIHLHRHLC